MNTSFHYSQQSFANGEIPINSMYPPQEKDSGLNPSATYYNTASNLFLEHASQHETEMSIDEKESNRVVTDALLKLRKQSQNFGKLLVNHSNKVVDLETKYEIMSGHKTSIQWLHTIPPVEESKQARVGSAEQLIRSTILPHDTTEQRNSSLVKNKKQSVQDHYDSLPLEIVNDIKDQEDEEKSVKIIAGEMQLSQDKQNNHNFKSVNANKAKKNYRLIDHYQQKKGQVRKQIKNFDAFKDYKSQQSKQKKISAGLFLPLVSLEQVKPVKKSPTRTLDLNSRPTATYRAHRAMKQEMTAIQKHPSAANLLNQINAAKGNRNRSKSNSNSGNDRSKSPYMEKIKTPKTNNSTAWEHETKRSFYKSQTDSPQTSMSRLGLAKAMIALASQNAPNDIKSRIQEDQRLQGLNFLTQQDAIALVINRLTHIMVASGSQLRTRKSRHKNQARDQMFIPDEAARYNSKAFVNEWGRILRNLRKTRTKTQFKAALKIAETSIIYQVDPEFIMKRLASLLRSVSPEQDRKQSQAKSSNFATSRQLLSANRFQRSIQAQEVQLASNSSQEIRNEARGIMSRLYEIQEDDNVSASNNMRTDRKYRTKTADQNNSYATVNRSAPHIRKNRVRYQQKQKDPKNQNNLVVLDPNLSRRSKVTESSSLYTNQILGDFLHGYGYSSEGKELQDCINKASIVTQKNRAKRDRIQIYYNNIDKRDAEHASQSAHDSYKKLMAHPRPVSELQSQYFNAYDNHKPQKAKQINRRSLNLTKLSKDIRQKNLERNSQGRAEDKPIQSHVPRLGKNQPLPQKQPPAKAITIDSSPQASMAQKTQMSTASKFLAVSTKQRSSTSTLKPLQRKVQVRAPISSSTMSTFKSIGKYSQEDLAQNVWAALDTHTNFSGIFKSHHGGNLNNKKSSAYKVQFQIPSKKFKPDSIFVFRTACRTAESYKGNQILSVNINGQRIIDNQVLNAAGLVSQQKESAESQLSIIDAVFGHTNRDGRSEALITFQGELGGNLSLEYFEILAKQDDMINYRQVSLKKQQASRSPKPMPVQQQAKIITAQQPATKMKKVREERKQTEPGQAIQTVPATKKTTTTKTLQPIEQQSLNNKPSTRNIIPRQPAAPAQTTKPKDTSQASPIPQAKAAVPQQKPKQKSIVVEPKKNLREVSKASLAMSSQESLPKAAQRAKPSPQAAKIQEDPIKQTSQHQSKKQGEMKQQSSQQERRPPIKEVVKQQVSEPQVVQQKEAEPRAAEPRAAEPREAEPRAAEPRAAEPREAEPRAAEPRAAEPRAAEPRQAEPRAAEPRAAEPREAEPRAAEPRAAEPRAAEPRAAEPREAEPRAAEPRAAEPREAESRAAEPRAAEPREAEPRVAEPHVADPKVAEQQIVEQKIDERPQRSNRENDLNNERGGEDQSDQCRDHLSKLLETCPSITQNFLLPHLDIFGMNKLNKVNRACNNQLDPHNKDCPQYADVFKKYTKPVFDKNRDWWTQIQYMQQETKSFPQVMITAFNLMKKPLNEPEHDSPNAASGEVQQKQELQTPEIVHQPAAQDSQRKEDEYQPVEQDQQRKNDEQAQVEYVGENATDILSRIVSKEPYVAENFLLGYLGFKDIANLYQVSKLFNSNLSPSDEYCPKYARVFSQYSGEVFDNSLDWQEQIQFVQDSTESFPQVMITTLSLRRKNKPDSTAVTEQQVLDNLSMPETTSKPAAAINRDEYLSWIESQAKLVQEIAPVKPDEMPVEAPAEVPKKPVVKRQTRIVAVEPETINSSIRSQPPIQQSKKQQAQSVRFEFHPRPSSSVDKHLQQQQQWSQQLHEKNFITSEGGRLDMRNRAWMRDIKIRKGRSVVRVIPLTKLPWNGLHKGHSNCNWDVTCWGCQQ